MYSLFKRLRYTIALLCTTLSFAHATTTMEKNHFSFTPYGGVAPSHFSSQVRFKQNFQFANLAAASTKLQKLNGDTIKSFTFNNMYQFPIIFGADFGYTIIDNIELIAGGNYLYAKGDRHSNQDVQFTLSKQQYYAGYIGGRYYFPIKFMDIQNLYHFIGAKIGYAKRSKLDMNNHVDGITLLKDYQIFEKSNGVLLGLQGCIGYKLNNHIALQLSAKIMWINQLKGRKSIKTLRPNANTTYTAKVTSRPEASFHYPITAGIRFTV